MRFAKRLSVGMLFVATSLATHAAHADAAAAPAPAAALTPRTVEKGGGIGRMFAWTTLVTGITGGLASGGLFLASKQALDDCMGSSLLGGLACAEEQQQYDDATGAATLGGIAAGGLLATSIVLFVVTDGKHTEIEYGDPPPPSLPIGGYVATGVTLAGAITAHVLMSRAADDLGDPSKHATPEETASLASDYRYARYAAGGLYGLTAGFAIMSALQTVHVVRAQRAETSTQVSVAPTASGAMFSLVGSF